MINQVFENNHASGTERVSREGLNIKALHHFIGLLTILYFLIVDREMELFISMMFALRSIMLLL